MNVVLLTSHLYSGQVVAYASALRAAGIPLLRIIVARPVGLSHLRQRVRNDRLIYRLLRHRGRVDALHSLGIPTDSLSVPFHAPAAVAYLRSLEADFLINCAGPIFRRATIETASRGLLNCHMGLLPEVRGMNVAEWSVLLGLPVGNTVHYIDPGIDTGGILAFYPVSTAGISSVAQLRRRLADLNGRHVAHTLKRLIQGSIQPVAQSPEQRRQYFRMHGRIRAAVDAILAAGYRPRVDVADRSYVLHPGDAPS